MLVREIKQALIGKTISYYDGWCGSSDYFKIGYLKKDGSSVRVFPEKGKGWGVFIPRDFIPELIEKGLSKDTMKLNGVHIKQRGNYADR